MSGSPAFSVRLHLLDGHPEGRISASTMNWTGGMLSSPRSLIQAPIEDLCEMETAVYMLHGQDADLGERVYIGNSHDVADRLARHVEYGDGCWDRVYLAFPDAAGLTTAQLEYVQARLVDIAQASGISVDSDPGRHPPLSEAPEADAREFLRQVCLLTPLLGGRFLDAKLVHAPDHDAGASAAPSP